MRCNLLKLTLCLCLLYVVTVRSEWKEPDPLVRSPFSRPPGKKSSQVDSHQGHKTDVHHKNHVHHDPRGNRIIPVRKKVSGHCGGETYIPRTHICCNGKLHKRQGMRPACCGEVLFDFVFDLCCDKNKVRPRTVGRPVC